MSFGGRPPVRHALRCSESGACSDEGPFECPFKATRFRASAKAAFVRVEIIFLSAWADHRHDADHQVVGLRHVGGDEPDASLLEPEHEMGVATQPIELGDQEGRPGLSIGGGFRCRSARVHTAKRLGLDERISGSMALQASSAMAAASVAGRLRVSPSAWRHSSSLASSCQSGS